MEKTPDHQYEQALRDIGPLLTDYPGTRELRKGELAEFGASFSTGFALGGLFPSTDIELVLLIPRASPFEVPRIALRSPTRTFDWPHVEAKNLLCLHDKDVYVDWREFENQCYWLLERAKDLVRKALVGCGPGDYEAELLNYWDRANPLAPRLNVCCADLAKARELVGCQHRGQWFVAENIGDLERWLSRWFAKTDRMRVFQVPLIRTDVALEPAAFPKCFADLCRLCGVEGEAVAKKAAWTNGPSGFPFVLEIARNGTRSLVGGVVHLPDARAAANLQHGQRTTFDPIARGFRKRPPPGLYHARLQHGAAELRTVRRFDPGWIHGRDKNSEQRVLQGKRILVFGCGSIGSGVIDLLAKAGVGRMTFVDPEILETENSSRHQLGTHLAGQHKTSALRSDIERRFPHLVCHAVTTTAQEYIVNRYDELVQHDLIIDATAAWPLSSMLDFKAKERKSFPPVLYLWAEEHCAAGHAYLVTTGGGCLACLCQPDGPMKNPVTKWEHAQRLAIPMCGGHFQPYGAIALSFIQASGAGVALQSLTRLTHATTYQVWVSSASYIASVGGQINTSWIDEYGVIPDGGGLLDITLKLKCEACGRGR